MNLADLIAPFLASAFCVLALLVVLHGIGVLLYTRNALRWAEWQENQKKLAAWEQDVEDWKRELIEQEWSA